VALGAAGIAKKSGAGATFTALLASKVFSAVAVVAGTPSSTPVFLCFAKLGNARSAPTTTVRHHLDIMFLPQTRHFAYDAML
jgi:predicted metal-binding membrane protein